MIKKILIGFIAVCMFTSTSFAQLSFSFTSPEPEYTADELLDAKIMDSVVALTMLGDGLGTCSGTIIHEDVNHQYIITAKHCVDSGSEMYVEHSKVTYQITSVDDDLAIVVIDEKIGNKIATSLGYRNGYLRDELYHVGFPSGVVYKASGTLTRITDDWQMYDFRAIPGCSGGGVFNKYGQLVGVLWGSYRGASDDSPIKSIGEPLKDIKRFLKLVLPKAL